jgi:hypothetical protein
VAGSEEPASGTAKILVIIYKPAVQKCFINNRRAIKYQGLQSRIPFIMHSGRYDRFISGQLIMICRHAKQQVAGNDNNWHDILGMLEVNGIKVA